MYQYGELILLVITVFQSCNFCSVERSVTSLWGSVTIFEDSQIECETRNGFGTEFQTNYDVETDLEQGSERTTILISKTILYFTFSKYILIISLYRSINSIRLNPLRKINSTVYQTALTKHEGTMVNQRHIK